MGPNLIKQITDAIPDAAFLVDTALQITMINDQACKLAGIERKQALESKCYEVFHTNVCETGCPLKQAYEKQNVARDVRLEILDKEGFEIPASASAAVLYEHPGNAIGGVLVLKDLSRERAIAKKLEGRFKFEDLISQDAKMHEMFSLISKVAPSAAPVLIQGESGTGKELVAKAIHNLSDRRDGPFVAINCGALPDNLLESELFGYKRGAFTDARQDKPGQFALANNGTLFLDEIADLPQNVQVKLLRVLQNGEFLPLGAVKPATSNCRIVAASNKDLEELMKTGGFRQDLFYRLNVISITIPPLRDRKGDIPLLAEEFIRRYNSLNNKDIQGLSQPSLKLLMDYDFPGNIRELENTIEHACILCNGPEIQVEHLPLRIKKVVPQEGRRSIGESEADVIRKALTLHSNNREETARYLGMSRSTLWRKIKKYGIGNGT